MDPKGKVKQLSATDAIFLSMDGETAWGHIGGVSVLDPSTAEDFGYERLLRTVEERIVLVPRFKWQLREVGLGLDEPYWVEAENFDIHDHVHRVAVPAPGTMRELGELIGLLYARALDRSKPLWEMWLIEGLEGGRYATFLKTHHCLMDGQSGSGLAEVIADRSPDAPASVQIPEAMQETAPLPPTERQVVTNAWRHWWGRSLMALRWIGEAAREAIGEMVQRHEPFDPPSSADVPRVGFNAAVGSRRQLACASLSLDRVKAIKKGLDVTVNDVILELVGSSVRRYLLERGELPDRPLVACMPVSLREAGDQRLGNQVTTAVVSLESDLRSPVDRLLRIHRGAARAREKLAETHFDMLAAVGDSLAPFAAHALAEMASSQAVVERVPFPGNFVISNVRASPTPLYSAGAKVTGMYPISMAQPGQGLNVTVLSYAGALDFGFTVDPHLVPDAWSLAEGLEPALKELEEDLASLDRLSR